MPALAFSNLQIEPNSFINQATSSKPAKNQTLFIEILTLLICILYGVTHLISGIGLISIFSFVSGLFCSALIYQTAKEKRLNLLILIGFFSAEAVALSLTAYNFGMRGLVLVFPLTAGAFYLLEFKIASATSVIISLLTLTCSSNTLDMVTIARVALAMALSIGFYANFSLVVFKQYKLTKHEALYDYLTKIPNRRGFLTWLKDELTQSKKKGQELTLYFIDLDKFKNINDVYGHKTGDALLHAFAMRLLHTIRDKDIIKNSTGIVNICRLSGDEFAFATREVTEDLGAKNLSTRLQNVMSQAYVIDNNRLEISISIGHCFASKVDWDVDKIVDYADKKMYEAKNARFEKYRTVLQLSEH